MRELTKIKIIMKLLAIDSLIIDGSIRRIYFDNFFKSFFHRKNFMYFDVSLKKFSFSFIIPEY